MKKGYAPHFFVPISSWNGEFISSRSANMHWYKGSTLIFALDKLIGFVLRRLDKQLRAVITDLRKVDN